MYFKYFDLKVVSFKIICKGLRELWDMGLVEKNEVAEV